MTLKSGGNRILPTCPKTRCRSKAALNRSICIRSRQMIDATRRRRGGPIGAPLPPRNECSVCVRRSARWPAGVKPAGCGNAGSSAQPED